jgi:ABC-type antimicrobial peptide transport system permease subunit
MKLGVATAQEMIEEFLKIFNVVALVLGAIGAISLFVAAIGVINTMIMATLERTKEIGLLRASGAMRSTVRRLFTFEASLLGMVGGAIGVGVAYGAVILARHFGAEELAKQGIDAAVISIPLWLAFSTVAITTFIGMLAGLLPAIRASRLNPIEALRYE